MTVEGWEPKVLAGARQRLSTGRVGAILCAFNDSFSGCRDGLTTGR